MAQQAHAVVYQLMHETPSQALILLLLLLPWLLLHLARRNSNGKQIKCLPPSPPGLPVIGHLHFVGELPHVSLRDLARTHGADGLMLLRLGAVPNLVVSSPHAAQAILRTHDHLFASRPPSTLSDALLYGSSDIGFAPYGEHWRQLRRLVATHLFSVKKVHSFRLARQQEVRLVMAKIREAAAARAAVDLSETINTYANDVVCRAVSGKFFREEGRNEMFRELIEGNSTVLGGFSLEDHFPMLAKVDLLSRSVCNKAKKMNKRWDDLLEMLMKNHEKKSMHRGRDDEEDKEKDFIDVLLSVQQEYHITRDHIKAVLMDMFAAGTDTSATVLELAMAELMRNPQLMAKLQACVRSHTPTGQEMVEQEDLAKLQACVRSHTPSGQEMVEEEDLAGMAYLKAVVKETLRLHPPAPLLVPHLSMADCEVDGYMVPSGTRVLINAWAIGRDPASWESPEEFLPERFVEGGAAAAVDFRGSDFQLVPFGAGRRICPGLNFGMATVEIMLANLVYCFDWELPAGVEKEDVDMTEVFGLTVHRKEKLMLVAKPHLTGCGGHL